MTQKMLANRKSTPWASAATTLLVVSLLSAVGAHARAASADVGPSPVASKKAALPSPGRSSRGDKRLDSGQEIARFSKILASDPNHAGALLGRGKAYVSRRKYVLAFADYDRAAQLAPQSKTVQYGRAAVRVLMQEQAARLIATKPTPSNAAPVMDGSQFDDDGTIRSHVAPPAPPIARN